MAEEIVTTKNDYSTAEALTKKDLDDMRSALLERDLRYAVLLDERQCEFFESKLHSRITNYYELKIAEDMKRVILGLHSDKTEVGGSVTFEIVHYGHPKLEGGQE